MSARYFATGRKGEGFGPIDVVSMVLLLVQSSFKVLL